MFLVTVRVFNRDSEKIVLVSYTCTSLILANRGLAISNYNYSAIILLLALTCTQETAKPFLSLETNGLVSRLTFS